MHEICLACHCSKLLFLMNIWVAKVYTRISYFHKVVIRYLKLICVLINVILNIFLKIMWKTFYLIFCWFLSNSCPDLNIKLNAWPEFIKSFGWEIWKRNVMRVDKTRDMSKLWNEWPFYYIIHVHIFTFACSMLKWPKEPILENYWRFIRIHGRSRLSRRSRFAFSHLLSWLCLNKLL